MHHLRIGFILFYLFLFACHAAYAVDGVPVEELKTVVPKIGSWTFSGIVSNESGDRYGYFFQIQRQGSKYHAQTALVEGQTNNLILFYEGSETIEDASLNWKVGRSFIRYNPINDSWVFGVKAENNKGFNFKVDMLKQTNEVSETLILKPGIQLQTEQTSSLNGHIQTGDDAKEQFVTGNNAWFNKLWFSKEQDLPHDVNTTFCRLMNDNGFYSANLKEADATGAAIAGWRDAAGKKIKISQFVSIKSTVNNECLLHLNVPKLNLKVTNTLKTKEKPLLVAGFSENSPKGFCFITDQSFIPDLPA
jgi:hypothetical protein